MRRASKAAYIALLSAVLGLGLARILQRNRTAEVKNLPAEEIHKPVTPVHHGLTTPPKISPAIKTLTTNTRDAEPASRLETRSIPPITIAQWKQSPSKGLAYRPGSATAGKQIEAAEQPFDEPMQAMRYYAQKRAQPGESFVRSELYIAARRRQAEMPRHVQESPAVRVPGLHPMTATLGGASDLGPGNIGGRTRALLINPASASIMYAGAVAGGVWRSTDGGASWLPVSDAMSNLAVSTLAMSPFDSNIVYAGTGEGYYNWDAVRGDGIFKTTDGGTTWTQLAATHANANFHYVNKIVVSPLNSNRLYAATNTGIFRSTDGGSSWLRIFTPESDGCQDLAIRTDQPSDYLFAACGQFSTGGGIYRSLAADSTANAGLPDWTKVYTETYMGRTSLAIAPSNQNVVYAMSASLYQSSPYYLGLLAVFRSVNSGDFWSTQVSNTTASLLNTLLLSNPYVGACQNQALNQGWYDNVIAVDPVDSNRVWAGGIDLFRSDDGGVHWGLASYWWDDTSSPTYSHADHHAIVFHPQYDGVANKIMFDANDGGLFKLDDARAATSTNACSTGGGAQWTSLNHQYATAQFYSGVPYPGGATYFGGTQDNGTLRGSDASGAQNWSRIYGGDGGAVAVDPTNTNTLYTETPYQSVWRSPDGGATFWNIHNPDNAAYFIAPYIFAPSTPDTLWGGAASVWRFSDGGTQYFGQTALGTTSGSVSALAVEPATSTHLVVGKGTGWIYNFPDIIGAVSTYSTAQPRSGWVSNIAFDPVNTQVVYATYSSFGGGHVYKSRDGGASWFLMDGTGLTKLPDVPVNSLVVDLYNPSHIYVATDIGVFTSLDGGGSSSTASWAVEATGLPAVPTESLSVDGSTNTLFAFTHGRGVWRMPLTMTGSNPMPKAPSLFFPKSITQGSLGFTLTVGGAGFVPSSVVRWNGSDRPTTYASPSLLQASISAADVASGTSATITVRSPAPGGGTSAPATFPITNTLANMNTSSPLMIGSISAQLSGSISTSDGYSYHTFIAYFRYSTSSDLSNSMTTPPQMVTNTSYYQPVIAGLTPNTTYYYRLEVTPTQYTATQSFTTAALPILATQDPLFVGSDFANLRATASWPGAYSATAWVWMDLSTDAGFSTGTRTPLGEATNSNGGTGVMYAPDGTLLPNTTYYYRGGLNLEPSYSGTYAQLASGKSFTTRAIVPTTLAATSVANATAQLNGTLDTGAGRYISGWFRWGTAPDLSNGTTTAPQSFYVATTVQNLAAALTGLTPGTTYFYRVESNSRTSSQTATILSFTTTGGLKKRRGQITSQ